MMVKMVLLNGKKFMEKKQMTDKDIIGKRVKIHFCAAAPYDGKEGTIEFVENDMLYGTWGGVPLDPEEDVFEICE